MNLLGLYQYITTPNSAANPPPPPTFHCSWCGRAFLGEPAATSTADPGRMKMFDRHECLIAWLDDRGGV